MDEKEIALNAIRNKLIGKDLTYHDIYAIMDQIAKKKLGDVLTTYFAASGYSKGFSNEELYFLTKAMVETGKQLHFNGVVADKHSIGGVPGTRTTLIVIPIIAAAGFTIPKSSSRAITTPDGTADDMEVIANVTFPEEKIYDIVKQTNGCIVWGGSVEIAPADDALIQVEKPLLFESYDKIVVSIMAKKISFGSNHVVIDIPYGASVKVGSKKDAGIIAEKFKFIADKFNIKIACLIHKTDEPVGKGIGPVLETKEALKVLEQLTNRPLDLEERSLHLAGTLLDLCLIDSTEDLKKQIINQYGDGTAWAKELLSSGKAHKKMLEIIVAQEGKPETTSSMLHPSNFSSHIVAEKNGTVTKINSKNATILAKILGAPLNKKSGIYLEKKIGDAVQLGDTLFTIYGQSEYNLKEAKETIENLPLYTF